MVNILGSLYFPNIRLLVGGGLTQGIWESWYNIPEAIFYLLEGDYKKDPEAALTLGAQG